MKYKLIQKLSADELDQAVNEFLRFNHGWTLMPFVYDRACHYVQILYKKESVDYTETSNPPLDNINSHLRVVNDTLIRLVQAMQNNPPTSHRIFNHSIQAAAGASDILSAGVQGETGSPGDYVYAFNVGDRVLCRFLSSTNVYRITQRHPPSSVYACNAYYIQSGSGEVLPAYSLINSTNREEFELFLVSENHLLLVERLERDTDWLRIPVSNSIPVAEEEEL